MSFPGPLSISPINNTNEQLIGLRAYQRVTAQVISVTGTTAILEVDGHPVVAQLTSADQASMLASQQTAQFLVTELTDNSVTLKFIKNEQTQPALLGVVANGPELAERILESNNIPITITNLLVTRSLLKQHLPVTLELLKELQSALKGLGEWKEADADLAAAMKSAGLPVTPQSLALTARPPVPTADAMSQLIAMLTQSTSQDLPEDILTQLRSNLRLLNSLIIKGDGKPSQLADQLKAAVEAFGRSLENVLLEQIQTPGKNIPEKGLMSLLKLQELLEQFGKQETARNIHEFITNIRREQFMNANHEPSQRYGEWSEISFMTQSEEQKIREEFSSARLRIARESKGDTSKINPANTRLILQVNLQADEIIEVDLSLSGKQIQTSVKANDPLWCEMARNELPTLQDTLKEFGYTFKNFQVVLEVPLPFNRIQNGTGSTSLMTVNIEI